MRLGSKTAGYIGIAVLLDVRITSLILPVVEPACGQKIQDGVLAPEFFWEKSKMIRQLEKAYRPPPFGSEDTPLQENLPRSGGKNAFCLCADSLNERCDYLRIQTRVMVSSKTRIRFAPAGQKRVVAASKQPGAMRCVNPIRG